MAVAVAVAVAAPPPTAPSSMRPPNVLNDGGGGGGGAADCPAGAAGTEGGGRKREPAPACGSVPDGPDLCGAGRIREWTRGGACGTGRRLPCMVPTTCRRTARPALGPAASRPGRRHMFPAVLIGHRGLFGRRPPASYPADPLRHGPLPPYFEFGALLRPPSGASPLRAPLQCPCRRGRAARPLRMPRRPRPFAPCCTVSSCAQDAPLSCAAPPPRPCRRRRAPSWGGRGGAAPRRARAGPPRCPGRAARPS